MIAKLTNIIKTADFINIEIDHFYSEIKNGTYKNEVDFYREKFKEIGKDASKVFKEKLPVTAISGIFKDSVKNANLKEHSNYICVDIDNVPQNEMAIIKQKLKQDNYVESCFVSCGGQGFAIVIKIDGSKHLDAFLSLEDYFFKEYSVTVDTSCKNVSRLRFYSYDFDIYINKKSKVFKTYLKPIYNKKQVVNTILTGTEFDELLSKVISQGKNLCEDYDSYLKIGFAFADEFGENGRQYFHAVSAQSSKYNESQCNRQYTHCLSAHGSKQIKIGTFYYFCKVSGLEIKTKESRHLELISKQAKKQGRNIESVINIAKLSGLNELKAKEVAEVVFNNNVNLNTSGEESNRMIILNYLNSDYNLKINSITRNIENHNITENGRPQKINDFHLNSMFLKFDENNPNSDISKMLFTSAIFSHEIQHYNPFELFFTKHQKISRSSELITELANSINSGTPNVEKWLKHWGCGMIASIFGYSSPLVLVFAGGQNTGKTEFFRRFLPFDLQEYYAESKLDAGKDDDILMCKKLIIMDDEFGGKSKKENKRFKELTSKHTFSIRAPYGRISEDLTRLSVLCGTTNDFSLLDDPTGNRRILPIEISSINYEKYNGIDKNSLFMAFYDLYKSGFKWHLNSSDIAQLNENSGIFEATNFEAELILSYFKMPEEITYGTMMTNTEIKIYLESVSKQKMFSANKLGIELKKLGFGQTVIKINGKSMRCYNMLKVNFNSHEKEPF